MEKERIELLTKAIQGLSYQQWCEIREKVDDCFWEEVKPIKPKNSLSEGELLKLFAKINLE